jgi:hypothetical protein
MSGSHIRQSEMQSRGFSGAVSVKQRERRWSRMAWEASRPLAVLVVQTKAVTWPSDDHGSNRFHDRNECCPPPVQSPSPISPAPWWSPVHPCCRRGGRQSRARRTRSLPSIRRCSATRRASAAAPIAHPWIRAASGKDCSERTSEEFREGNAQPRGLALRGRVIIFGQTA